MMARSAAWRESRRVVVVMGRGAGSRNGPGAKTLVYAQRGAGRQASASGHTKTVRKAARFRLASVRRGANELSRLGVLRDEAIDRDSPVAGGVFRANPEGWPPLFLLVVGRAVLIEVPRQPLHLRLGSILAAEIHR